MWFLKDENYTPKEKKLFLSNQLELKYLVPVIDTLEALDSCDGCQNGLGDDEEYDSV